MKLGCSLLLIFREFPRKGRRHALCRHWATEFTYETIHVKNHLELILQRSDVGLTRRDFVLHARILWNRKILTFDFSNSKVKIRVCRNALPSCWAAIINLLVCSYCCDLSVICRGLRLFLRPLLLSALIEILLCRMFPHPRRKSHLARPESSENIWDALENDNMPKECRWCVASCQVAGFIFVKSEFNGCRDSGRALDDSFSGGRRRSSTTRASWPGTLHLTASING